MFEELHRKFEKNETDLFNLQQEDGFSRYILVRSLDNDHLKDLIETSTGIKETANKVIFLYKKLFESDVTNEQIIEYIAHTYPVVRQKRLEQEEFLPQIISEFGDVKCGVRNDNLNDTAKELVRDKTIETLEDLETRINNLLNGKIKGYLMWQYYNQVTNDLIEHLFNDHPNVIPTLRKIKYVDFLVNVDGEIIPFDLKITHISDEYYDLYKKGLTQSFNQNDDFVVEENSSEIEVIKEFYKRKKADYNLPNYGSLKKQEMIDIISEINSDETNTFIVEIINSRKQMVDDISSDLKSLEWWNYKYQGERLFKNNNRFFVFLAYKEKFEDARPLKGNLETISEKVKKRLDTIVDGDFNEINYYYTKDAGLTGHYKVISTSVMVTD